MVEETEQEKQKKKNPIMEKTNTRIFTNVLIAIIIMVYFVGLYLGYDKLEENIFERALQLATMVLLAITIIVIEIAYKKDSGLLAINGIEALVLSCHTLSIPYITQLFSFDFKWYVTISAYIFAIYFVFKSIVIYTLGRKEYLRSLSDIREIVKEEEPRKKEATKRKKVEEIEEADKEEKIADDENAEVKKVIKSKKTKTKKVNQKKKEEKTEEVAVKETKTEETKAEEAKPKKRGRPKKKVKKVD